MMVETVCMYREANSSRILKQDTSCILGTRLFIKYLEISYGGKDEVLVTEGRAPGPKGGKPKCMRNVRPCLRCL